MHYQSSSQIPGFPHLYMASSIADFLLCKDQLVPTNTRTFVLACQAGVEFGINLNGLIAVELPAAVINHVEDYAATMIDTTASLEVRLDTKYGLRPELVAEEGKKVFTPALIYLPKLGDCEDVVFLHRFSDEGPMGGFRERVRREFALDGSDK